MDVNRKGTTSVLPPPFLTVTVHPVVGRPLVAENHNPPPLRPRRDPQLIIKDVKFCIKASIVLVTSLIVFAVLPSFAPKLPSISIKSMSITTIHSASETQVRANLEAVFDPVVNNNKHNNIVFHHLNVSALNYCDKPLRVNQGFFSNVTFEEPRKGNGTAAAVVRMEGVVVHVDEYEQRIYGRYGVSYLRFEVEGLVRINNGGWWVSPWSSMKGWWVSRWSSMKARCGEWRVVYPLFQWNETRRVYFEPPNKCDVSGDWNDFRWSCNFIVIICVCLFAAILLSMPRVVAEWKEMRTEAAAQGRMTTL